MIALRHRITAAIAAGRSAESVGFGFVHELTSVQQLTKAGLVDGASFGEVLRRLQTAHDLRGEEEGRPFQPGTVVHADFEPRPARHHDDSMLQ